MALGAASMIAGLAAPAFQTGLGIYQAVQGNRQRKRAEEELADVRQQMEDTTYADYNQAYYDELNRRAQVGLPQEQMLAMQQGADRAAGVALATSEDRRGGLMGIGRAQSSLADAYRNIGLADVAQREQNAQMVLQEMSDRGVNTLQEQRDLQSLDYGVAREQRQEAMQRSQAGMQNLMGGVTAAGNFLGGMFGGSENPFNAAGKGAAGVAQQTAAVQARSQASPTQGVNIAGQTPVVGIAPPAYNQMAYGFGTGQGISYPY